MGGCEGAGVGRGVEGFAGPLFCGGGEVAGWGVGVDWGLGRGWFGEGEGEGWEDAAGGFGEEGGEGDGFVGHLVGRLAGGWRGVERCGEGVF